MEEFAREHGEPELPPPDADAPPSPAPGESFEARTEPEAIFEARTEPEEAPPERLRQEPPLSLRDISPIGGDAETKAGAMFANVTETVPPPLWGGGQGEGVSSPTAQAEAIEESASVSAPDAQTIAAAPVMEQGAETPSATEMAWETAPAPVMELRKPDAPDAAEPRETDAPDAAELREAENAPDAAEPDAETPPVTEAGRVKPRRERRFRWLWGFVCGLAVAMALAVGARIWEQRRAVAGTRFEWNFRENYEESESRQDLSIRIPTWPVGEGPAFSLLREHGDAQTAQEVYRNVNPSVVTVIVELNNETAAVGTGVIFSDDGYFVTNYHVIQGGSQCRAMLDSGHSYPALFVAGDERNDLALLKMDASGPFPAAQFGDSESLTVGDPVYAIGNPLGIEFRGTLTNGIISAIDRDVLVDGRTMTLIQTNAALNSGNSGGPLINEYGQVIGINVVKMSSRRSTVEGLGFAIPSAFMERLVNDLLAYGESQPEPVIGVSVDSFGTEVEPDVWGIGVLKVEPDSAAEKAGVKVGDYIISADAETVSNSRDLLRVRRRYHVGESMALTLWRDGERVDAVISFTE